MKKSELKELIKEVMIENDAMSDNPKYGVDEYSPEFRFRFELPDQYERSYVQYFRSEQDALDDFKRRGGKKMYPWAEIFEIKRKIL